MVDPDDFRSVMRNLVAGVTVVTTSFEGKPKGMTATSFTSVSMDPMLVQVSLDRDSRTHDAVEGSGKFAVNILAADQEDIARHFSTAGVDRFQVCEFRDGVTGMPLIVGAIGHLECKVVEETEGGDHTIFIGQVVHADTEDRPPLLYFRGDYRRLAERNE